MKCSRCGFEIGERVQMLSGFFDTAGTHPVLHGKVEAWDPGCHAVFWEELPCGTPLPNPNVRAVALPN